MYRGLKGQIGEGENRGSTSVHSQPLIAHDLIIPDVKIRAGT